MKRIITIFDTKRGSRIAASLLAFIGSLAAYLLTIEPDASYWDCPEYLTTAIRLEIGHPPGNPTWTLMGRVFSLLGFGNPQWMAIAVNCTSALFTALATGMLAAIIYILLSRIGFPVAGKGGRKENLLRFIPAVGGALCFGWADSPWFSAVEAEVYAMSLFLTALCVRIMVAWSEQPSGRRNPRLIMLIVYLTGLSIGVHQLNLLVIPALGLIWLFSRREERVGVWRIIAVLSISCGAVGAILLGMMPGVVEGASALEIYCVNNLKLPLHSGVWSFWGIALLITWTVPVMMRHTRRRYQMLAWVPGLLLTGYASYMVLVMRGAANPPMNEGAPENIVSLAGYLGRDQYGSTPLFYGNTPYSPTLRQERIKEDGTADYSRFALRDGRAMYAVTDTGYAMYERKRSPIYAPEMNMWLPRLTSKNGQDIEAYADWAGMTQETMVPVEVSYALDSLGNPVGRLMPDGTRVKDKELRPTYLQQFRYLMGYQIGYMYFRYLLWNYSGRQNDRFAVGEVEHGNFITGIPAADNLMLGDQSKLPAEIGKENPGRNVYFMLPLLTGILGIILLQHRGRRGKRANLVITVLFLMTGLAIVFYINQSPREPRERDYSFLGSLWAYAIWIGCGMAMLINGAIQLRLRKGRTNRWARWLLWGAIAYCVALPCEMLYENYDDHDRSGRHGVTDYATNLLESLEPNAILFTNGDNFTFPLWWAQEVVGVRRDVKIVNVAYLGTDWYIRQMMTDGEATPGLKMTASPDQFKFGDYKFTSYMRSEDTPSAADTLGAVNAVDALRNLYSEDTEDKRLPPLLKISNPEGGKPVIVRTAAVASGSGYMGLRNLAMLDIIATNAAADNPRPVYWQSSLSAGDYSGMLPYSGRMLHTRRLTYTDSLDAKEIDAFLDIDMSKAKGTLSGRIPSREGKYIYADDTFGRMITSQRLGLLRLGGRLLKAQRYGDALEVARIIEDKFPAWIYEYQIYTEVDSTCNEGIDLARLYLESARGLSRSEKGNYASEYKHGQELLVREQNRIKSWKAYYEALPPRLRSVMSPKGRRKARVLPHYVDSLVNRYR